MKTLIVIIFCLLFAFCESSCVWGDREPDYQKDVYNLSRSRFFTYEYYSYSRSQGLNTIKYNNKKIVEQSEDEGVVCAGWVADDTLLILLNIDHDKVVMQDGIMVNMKQLTYVSMKEADEYVACFD